MAAAAAAACAAAAAPDLDRAAAAGRRHAVAGLAVGRVDEPAARRVGGELRDLRCVSRGWGPLACVCRLRLVGRHAKQQQRGGASRVLAPSLLHAVRMLAEQLPSCRWQPLTRETGSIAREARLVPLVL
jgi:hypothetical protein